MWTAEYRGGSNSTRPADVLVFASVRYVAVSIQLDRNLSNK